MLAMNRSCNTVVMSHGGIIALCMAAFFACSAADWIPPQVKRPEFVLPDTLYAATGVECNVYFASALDSVRPDRASGPVCVRGAFDGWCLPERALDVDAQGGGCRKARKGRIRRLVG